MKMNFKTIQVKIEKKEVEKKILRDFGEPMKIFKKRIKFILAQKINSEKDLLQAETYSRVWSNILYRKVTYSDKIMEQLKKMKQI